jgi:hypothetical protein
MFPRLLAQSINQISTRQPIRFTSGSSNLGSTTRAEQLERIELFLPEQPFQPEQSTQPEQPIQSEQPTQPEQPTTQRNRFVWPLIGSTILLAGGAAVYYEFDEIEQGITRMRHWVNSIGSSAKQLGESIDKLVENSDSSERLIESTVQNPSPESPEKIETE